MQSFLFKSVFNKTLSFFSQSDYVRTSIELSRRGTVRETKFHETGHQRLGCVTEMAI